MHPPAWKLAIAMGAALAAGVGSPRHAWSQFPATASSASVDVAGGQANGNSQAPALSEDGRFVAFTSHASDLVPGDTNGNGDVFVRDMLSAATERVSVTWKGQEARGDSSCPSISGDGRFVAFQSRAWNLYAGGANLGTNRWDVYVRDRVLQTTTRLTVAHDGGDPDGNSGCPSISADGRRVVFSSTAQNLIPEPSGSGVDVFLWDADDGLRLLTVSLDGDEDRAYGEAPVISGDGNVVAFVSGSRALVPAPPFGNIARIYVMDLTTGAITHESVSTGGAYGRRDSRWPVLSHDGRYVAFLTSSALVQPLPLEQRQTSAYLRDRVAGTTVLASPARSGLACGPADARFPCRMDPVTRLSLSGDGRYLAMASRATNFLPGSVHKGDQIYVYDRITGRLRRSGIGPAGAIGDGCSLEPALSADGATIAYRTNATNVAPGAGKPIRDIVESTWRCLADGSCRLESMCPKAPGTCAPAKRARLLLKRNPPGGRQEDQLLFRWQADPLDEPFPDPTAGAEYHLCLYAGEAPVTELDVAVPPDGDWGDLFNGHRLRRGGSGISAVILRNGDRRFRVTVKGAGPLLDAPYLPLVAPTGFTVQLHDVAGGRCFGADFPATAIRRNVPGDLSTTRGRLGYLSAEIP